MKLTQTFRSLKYRNFRLFFPGLITSQVGIWIQNVALSWVVYDMTQSPFMMGTIMFLNTIPLFIITPFAGVIVDKFNRHRLLMIIQICFALQAFLMAAITLGGYLRIWNIIILGVFLNIVAAIDAPLRQSTYVLLVDDKNDLGNAISLNSTCFNMARLLGPAVAGVLLSAVGAGWCFAINFLCILPCVFLVAMIKFKDEKSEKVKNETIFEGLKEGLDYSIHSQKIILLLLFSAIFSFIALTYPMLMPVYTKEILHANAQILGYVMSSAGIGAVTASMFLASKTSLRGLKYILCFGAILLSCGFIELGFNNHIATACLIMFCVGFGMTSAFTSDSTLLQSVIDDDKRGRVMSIYAVCFMGATSISNFVAGSVAQMTGIANTFIIFGIILLAAAFLFLLKFHHLKFISRV